jgi:hypothetical protein
MRVLSGGGFGQRMGFDSLRQGRLSRRSVFNIEQQLYGVSRHPNNGKVRRES